MQCNELKRWEEEQHTLIQEQMTHLSFFFIIDRLKASMHVLVNLSCNAFHDSHTHQVAIELCHRVYWMPCLNRISICESVLAFMKRI